MENKSVTLAAQVLAPAVSEIRSLLEASRKNVAQQVNQELLSTYWKIGEIVVRCEQNDSIRAAYGEKTLSQLSRALTKELGKGFSRSNVYNMRQSQKLEYIRVLDDVLRLCVVHTFFSQC